MRREVIDAAVYAGCYWGAVGAVTLGWGFRAAGRRHVPRRGPALILCNHQSFLDPCFLGAASPRPLAYLARDTLFHNTMFARLIRLYGAVPIDRNFGREGLRTVQRELERGRAVVMFPEGERSPTGELQELKPGVSLLLKRIDCPVIPAALVGAFEAWPRQRSRPRSFPLRAKGGPVCVAFGDQISPRDLAGDRGATLECVRVAIAACAGRAERLRAAATSWARAWS